jgi:hypothetical protein
MLVRYYLEQKKLAERSSNPHSQLFGEADIVISQIQMVIIGQ